MAEVVYVPVTQDMPEDQIRRFQAALDVLGGELDWAGVFVVMRCRPALPLAPATGGSPP